MGNIKKLHQKDPRVHGFQLSRNFGQHNAIFAGLAEAQGGCIVVIDCDLQDPPEAIPEMHKKINQGYDVVMAARKNRKLLFLQNLFDGMFYKPFIFLSGINHAK